MSISPSRFPFTAALAKNFSARLATAMGSLAMLGTFFAAPHALATESINVQTFNPSTSDHFVFLEDGFRSEWPKKTKYYFGVNYNYDDAPFVAVNSTGTSNAFNIINSIQTVDLFFGMKISNNFALYFGVPIHEVSFSGTNSTFALGNQTALGDIKIMGKIRLTDDDSNTSVALVPEFHLPTGSTQYFVSDASTYVALRATVERQFDAWTFVANLGFAVAANSRYSDPSTFTTTVDARKRLLVGVGGFLPFNDTWGLDVEFSNISMIPIDSNLNPNDVYGGIRYAANDNFVLTGGASVGKIGGAGGSDYRIVAGVRYTMFDQNGAGPRPISGIDNTASKSQNGYVSNSTTNSMLPPAKPAVIAQTPRASLQARKIEITTPIQFEKDTYRLAPDSQQILDDVATLLNNHKNVYQKVMVDGHTGNEGNDAYCLKLSLARARAVKSYLISKGVNATALEARGFGKRKPKVGVNAPHANQTNRRVEFLIVN